MFASSKSLTTKSDLSIGIGKAIQDVLDKSASNPSEIVLASLSTTLATNALVEGHGENVGLVAIGFTEQDLQRQGLSKVIKNDPVFFLTGGHTHSGEEKYPLERIPTGFQRLAYINLPIIVILITIAGIIPEQKIYD